MPTFVKEKDVQLLERAEVVSTSNGFLSSQYSAHCGLVFIALANRISKQRNEKDNFMRWHFVFPDIFFFFCSTIINTKVCSVSKC